MFGCSFWFLAALDVPSVVSQLYAEIGISTKASYMSSMFHARLIVTSVILIGVSVCIGAEFYNGWGTVVDFTTDRHKGTIKKIDFDFRVWCGCEHAAELLSLLCALCFVLCALCFVLCAL